MAVIATPVGTTPDEDVARVAAYLRVSTEHQTEANQRPDVDRLIAARFPRAQVAVYSERRSATKKRLEYDRMLRDAKVGKFEVLVVWAIDRFGRSMVGNINDVLALEAAGVRVVSCRDPWLDQQGPNRDLLLANFSWFAQQEHRRITERIVAGQARVREHGGVLGRPAFGLRRVREAAPGVPRGLPQVVLDEAALPTVRRMAELLVETGSQHGAAMRLQTEKGALPLSPNGLWDHKSVKRILQNKDLRRLGALPAELFAQVDAILLSRRRAPSGAATPKYLAVSFLACGVCGSSIGGHSSKKRHRSYFCTRFNQKGKAACPGVGYRTEWEVDRALRAVVRSAIDGRIKARALEIVRERLESQPRGASEREAVAHELSKVEAEGRQLAKAVARGGKLDVFVYAAKENQKCVTQLRARLARLDAKPVALDPRRRIAEIERGLTKLSKTLSAGGLAARPVVEAVLQGRQLTVTPVLINGRKRWRLTGKLPAGYLATIDGAESSLSCSSSHAGRLRRSSAMSIPVSKVKVTQPAAASSSVRFTTPLAFDAFGGLFVERRDTVFLE